MNKDQHEFMKSTEYYGNGVKDEVERIQDITRTDQSPRTPLVSNPLLALAICFGSLFVLFLIIWHL